MARRFVFPAAGRVEMAEFDPGEPGAGEVRVRMAHSLLSTGTETTAFSGRFDPASHWGAYVQYPFHPGYSSTGEVTTVGPEVSGVAIGDRIFTMWPHASEQTMPAVAAFPLPEGVDPVLANWAALAGVAFVGIRRARIEAGETVVVIGAGPVGQMLIRWAAISGAGRIIAIDPAAGRLDLARAGGATDVLASPVAEASSDVRAANGGVRAPVVIDATGRAATFAEALPLVADFGRLVIVGDTGDPAGQHLTSDVIARGVSIVGAHGNYIPYVLGMQGAAAREGRAEEQVAAERTLGWRAFAATFFDLVQQGRFPLDGTISHTVPATDAAEGYRLVTEQREQTMGVSFAW